MAIVRRTAGRRGAQAPAIKTRGLYSAPPPRRFTCSPPRPGDKIQQLFKKAVGGVETKGSLNAHRSYRRLQAIQRNTLMSRGGIHLNKKGLTTMT